MGTWHRYRPDDVAVLIPAHNEAAVIAETLDAATALLVRKWVGTAFRVIRTICCGSYGHDGWTCQVMSTAMTSIALRPREVVAQARSLLAENGTPTKEARVLVVGVAYKPGVADVRESPALEIIEELLAVDALVSFTDPMVERLSVPDGTLTNCPAPERGEWDLVILIHPDGWSYNGSPILDTTYRRFSR